LAVVADYEVDVELVGECPTDERELAGAAADRFDVVIEITVCRREYETDASSDHLRIIVVAFRVDKASDSEDLM